MCLFRKARALLCFTLININMRRIAMILLSALLLTACEKSLTGEESEVDVAVGGDVQAQKVKKFTFTCKGDFGDPRMRGYLASDGQEMTDLWVFDYMGDSCVQSVHQTPVDETWGAPVMSLAYGSHHVYFVASRGDAPVVDGAAHTVTWATPRDTFWKDYEVDVVSTSNGNRAVTLDRMVTRLRLSVEDEIREGCSSIAVMPDLWYYGLDYMTGDAVAGQRTERVVSVPTALVGTTGQLSLSVFGLSPSLEWNTDVTVEARSSSGDVLGTAVIRDAPFIRNRSTEYSGCLFTSGTSADVTLRTGWADPHTGVW